MELAGLLNRQSHGLLIFMSDFILELREAVLHILTWFYLYTRLKGA